jgi:hypothetical protein
MGKIDLTNEEIRKEIYEKLKGFKYKSEAYRYFKIPDNQYGIKYLKKIAEKVGFDLNYYKEKRDKNRIKNCLYCGKELSATKDKRRKFCNHSCATKYNNKLRNPISEETKEKISDSVYAFYHQENNSRINKKNCICKNCGKEFKTYEKNRQFCSTSCYKEYHSKTKTERWLNGLEIPNGTKVPEFIRKYLLNKFNNKCQLCGWGEENPITHKIPLQIHHIDGDCTNNKEDNLQLLCPNCHSLTETFGSKNKGSKRYKLMEYKHNLTNARIIQLLKNVNDNDREKILKEFT